MQSGGWRECSLLPAHRQLSSCLCFTIQPCIVQQPSGTVDTCIKHAHTTQRNRNNRATEEHDQFGQHDQQQQQHVGGGDPAADAAAAAAIEAAAAAAAAGAEVNASQAMVLGVVGADPAGAPTGDAAAQAAADAQQAAQLAQANAEAAQQAVQLSQQQLDLLAQAGTMALDPATLAAMQGLPVSGALALDPNIAAMLQSGLQFPGGITFDANSAMQLLTPDQLQLATAHPEMYMGQHTGHEEMGEYLLGTGTSFLPMGGILVWTVGRSRAAVAWGCIHM